MKRRNWKYWLRLILAFTTGSMIGLVMLLIGLSYVSVQDILHPPRRIAPGTTLRENGIDFQDLELVTRKMAYASRHGTHRRETAR
jgi:hypothetical protein